MIKRYEYMHKADKNTYKQIFYKIKNKNKDVSLKRLTKKLFHPL